MSKKCVVHVGPFKTGSSSFQELLHIVKNALFLESVYIPEIKKPGGHYEWLENRMWVNDGEIDNSSGMIISSEIISSWNEKEIKTFDDFLTSKGYLTRYVAVCRNEMDVFISMNKDHLRKGEDCFIRSDDFDNMKNDPSYSAMRFTELMPQDLKNRTTVINYSRNVLIDLAEYCEMILCKPILKHVNKTGISNNIFENKSLLDGREWMFLLLKNTELYKSLPLPDRQNLIRELLDANWNSDFLEFKISAKVCNA